MFIGILAFSRAVSMWKLFCNSEMNMSTSLVCFVSPRAMLPWTVALRWNASNAVITGKALFRKDSRWFQCVLLYVISLYSWFFLGLVAMFSS